MEIMVVIVILGLLATLVVPNVLGASDEANLKKATTDVGEGETFLVHGGAGGLGTTAIQLGKAFGATVVATDSPAARCKICGDLGADQVIDYDKEDFVALVREKFGGADVILDIVGGPYVQRNIKAARHDGRIVQLAFAMGSRIDIDLMPIMLKRLVYTGSTLRTRPQAFKAEVARQLESRVWPLIAEGAIKSVRFAPDCGHWSDRVMSGC